MAQNGTGRLAKLARDARGRIISAKGNGDSAIGTDHPVVIDTGDDHGTEPANPAEALAGGSTEPVRRGPGRPRGSSNGSRNGSRTGTRTGETRAQRDRPAASAPRANLSTITRTLTEAHKAAADFLDLPALDIGNEKAERLAGALLEVRKHFPAQLPMIDPKYIALATFAWVGFNTYKDVPSALARKRRGLPPAVANRANPPTPDATRGEPVAVPDAAPTVSDWFAAPGTMN